MELYILLILSGVFAGFIGTLAGLGAAISLYLLLDFFQLDPLTANATMRVGVLAMAVMAIPPFYNNKKLHLESSKFLVLAISLGSIAGFITVNHVDPSASKVMFKYLLPVLLVLVIANPKKLIENTGTTLLLNQWIGIPFFLILGFYAGFIQIGTGIIIVVFLSLAGKLSLVDATGIKILCFAAYTSVGVIIFAYFGKINWLYGIILAIGQGIGGFLAAKFANSYADANKYVRQLLIFMLLTAIIRMFELHKLFV